ncbi:MAG: nucleotidyltransferase [Halanaerobacter sp.]
MKVLGIITEYNPFHNGHQLHIEKSLTESKADAVICIMSGSFLQRGTPALTHPWARAKMALEAGVDLVIQLPVSYSLRSAEYFAYGSVKLLDAAGIVDSLCFGSETGCIKPLKFLGQLLAEEPPQLSQLIQKNLETNNSYPEARATAVSDYLAEKNDSNSFSQEEIKRALHSSNNILGIEYIKALTKLNSSITPLTIQREGEGYNSKHLSKISSATAIRAKIEENSKNDKPLLDAELEETMPAATIKILKEEFTAGRGAIFPADFAVQLLTILRRAAKEDIRSYEDIRGGLENRIKRAALNSTTWSGLIEKIKTKRFTQTRIQRILAQILIDLKTEDLNNFAQAGGPQYFRILGFNQQGKKLLHQIKEQSELPLISRVANHFKSNYQPQNLLQQMLSYDLQANNLYSLALANQHWQQGNLDYKRPPIIKT